MRTSCYLATVRKSAISSSTLSCSYRAELLSLISDQIQRRKSVQKKIIIDDFKPALLRTLKDHKRFVAAENSVEYRISLLHYCFNELLIRLT